MCTSCHYSLPCIQLNKLTEGEILGNDSYKITTQAITSSGANSSIVLLTVEFQPTVKLAENTTSITSVTDPFNGANYNILKIFAATPSGKSATSLQLLSVCLWILICLINMFLVHFHVNYLFACLQKHVPVEQAPVRLPISVLAHPLGHVPVTALEHVK